MIFDCLVIGKGLIGAAAAKYLSTTQKSVAVLGPDEPDDDGKAVVFSSHYDQARVQRMIGTDPVWTQLNLQSARQYESLQEETGISFHSKVGCLYVNPAGTDRYLEQIGMQAAELGLSYEYFDNGDSLIKTFGHLALPVSSRGILERSPSGFINPRLLITAQLDAFQRRGGAIIPETARDISYQPTHATITTFQGNVYAAKKILLCPGAFINFFNLTEKKLALVLKSETVLWAQVNRTEADRLASLPSLLYEIDTPQYQNVYLIQPVRYPDGNFYLKMGCNLPGDLYFDDLKDIQDWFRNGNSDQHRDLLQHALLQIIPRLQAENFFTKRCIVAFTKHHKPYIGELNQTGLFIACGGNGYSAMCSDALGRLAADVTCGSKFPAPFSAESFQPLFA